MRHGPPARDCTPSLHSDGEALPEVACLSCVTSNDRDILRSELKINEVKEQ